MRTSLCFAYVQGRGCSGDPVVVRLSWVALWRLSALSQPVRVNRRTRPHAPALRDFPPCRLIIEHQSRGSEGAPPPASRSSYILSSGFFLIALSCPIHRQ